MTQREGSATGEACLLTARPAAYDCPVRRAATGVMTYCLVFLFGFFVMLYFASAPRQFSDGSQEIGVSGNDSFYHLKMASMLTEHGLVSTFPWLKFAYFRNEGDAFVSHHYGFHCLLLPFVKASEWLTGEPLSGGRWAVSTFFGVNVMLFFAILRAGRVPWPWVWLLVWMLLPFQFYMRHGYVRAIGPSLICMLLIVLLVMRRRPVLVGILAALSNHVYLGAVMYTPVIIVAFAAACVIDRDGWRKFPWKIVVASVIGWLIGLATYPYFWGMFEFLYMQVFGTGLSPDIEVGREWKPYEGVWWFARDLAGPLLLVFGASALIRFRLGPRLSADEMFLMLLNVVFLVLTLTARRFIEYWPAFALLSAALMIGPLIRRWFGIDPSASESSPLVATPVSRSVADLVWQYCMSIVAFFVIVRGALTIWRHAEEWRLSEAWPLAGAAIALILLVAIFGSEAVRTTEGPKWERLLGRTLFALAGVAFVTFSAFPGWLSVRDGSKLRFDLPEVRKLMAFLKMDSDAGDVVFTTDWDDFPLFFYHNSYDYYVVGLDPKFTHARKPVLWERYVKITRGEAPTRISVAQHDADGRAFTDRVEVKVSDIRDEFEAKYVITDRDHKKLAGQLSQQKDLARLVFPCSDYAKCRNAPYLVFRIVDPVTLSSRFSG